MAIRLSENFRALFYAPFYAAHAIDAYHAEGVDVTLLSSPEPARTAAALRAGDVRCDVGWTASRAADPCAGCRRPTAFASATSSRAIRSSSSAVSRGRISALPIWRVSVSRSVAEVPTPWLCLQDDLRRAGVDPATLHRVSGPSMAQNAAALRAGTLGAAQLFQPYAEELIASGAGHVWYAAADRGLTAYTALITRRPLLDTRREELLAMTRAMTRTLRWIDATPGSDIARALGEFFPEVAQDIFAAAIDRYRALHLFATDPELQREGFDRLQGAMRSGGALNRPIAFETCVDNALARQVIVDG